MVLDRSSHGWLATMVAVLVVGCSPAPGRARHTVEDYRADAELRRAQLARCANDPGTLGDTPDCINAREAARREGQRSLRDLPPVKLPTPQRERAPSTPSSAARDVEQPEDEAR